MTTPDRQFSHFMEVYGCVSCSHPANGQSGKLGWKEFDKSHFFTFLPAGVEENSFGS